MKNNETMQELSIEEMENVQGGSLFCDMAGLTTTVGLMGEIGPLAPIVGLGVKNLCEWGEARYTQ